MAYLADTSILVRLGSSLDPQHGRAQHAVSILLNNGETIYITPQCLIEFHSVATRPATSNGLGFTLQAAAKEAAQFEQFFPLLLDTRDIYPIWKQLVSAAGISGKQVHDTRLVAVCHVHGVSHLLTFNPKDFVRFQTIGPGLTVVEPDAV